MPTDDLSLAMKWCERMISKGQSVNYFRPALEYLQHGNIRHSLEGSGIHANLIKSWADAYRQEHGL